MPTKSKRAHYLLVLRQPHGGVPPPAELQKIMARFGAWMEALRQKGMVEGTNGLEPGGKVLRKPHGRRLRITDGPYVEAKEVVGGYVLISAPSFAAAMRAAGACPGLDYAMTVEVRPVQTRTQK